MTLERVRELGDGGAECVRGLLRAVSPLSSEQYQIAVSSDSAVPDGVTVELSAVEQSHDCAYVRLHVAKGAGVIWVTVGRGLDFEIPVPVTDAWRPFDLTTVEDAVEGIASAAIRGNVSEAVTMVGEEVMKSEGTIAVGGRSYPVSISRGRPNSKGEQRVVAFAYGPYAPIDQRFDTTTGPRRAP